MRDQDLSEHLLTDLRTYPIQGFVDHTNIDIPLYSHVKDNLWQGGCPVNKVPADFKTVLNLYPWGKYEVPETTTYREAKLHDNAHMPDEDLLVELADFVREQMKTNMTLVHCQAGLNRSGLIAGLALVRDGMNALDAVRLLRAQRCSMVLCNETFRKWLLRYENKHV
jgi:protein-tyrosine phosphatase